MCATQFNPNRPNHCFTASPVRAHERQIRAPKKGFIGGLGRGAYPARCTVDPYNEYITSTNPIERHAMSLTWTQQRICTKQRASKHAKTQPLYTQTQTQTRPSRPSPSPSTKKHQICTRANCSSVIKPDFILYAVPVSDRQSAISQRQIFRFADSCLVPCDT